MLKFYKNLKPYVGLILIMLVLLFGQTLAMLFLPNMMSKIVDLGVIKGDIEFIYRQGLLMILVTLISSSCAIGVGYLASKVGVGVCTDVRKKLFKHINKFTLEEFDKVGTASLTTRSTNDVAQVQDFTIMMFRVIVIAPIMCIGAIALATFKNPTAATVIWVCMPAVIVFLVLIMRKAFPIFMSMQEKLDKLNLIMRENVTGVRVIRAFTAEKREEERFLNANTDLTQTSIKSQVLMSTLMPMLMLIINLGTIAVVWIGGGQIAANQMQVGDLIAFIQYLVLIMYSLVMMAMIFAFLPRASVCAKRINEVLEIEPKIKNAQNTQEPKEKTGIVEFKDVSFGYAGASKNAINNISFCAKPGETTAIIGATGAGKSSIINLIPRLYDASQGSVLVDNVDVRQYDIEKLRKRIGFVPQKSLLFSGTIKENIAYEDINMPKENIERAAKIAQAEEFINSKRDKYDDHIAQGGSNVSGGQRQRLSIARAMASDASIYVFDDSFSALDFKTDANLRRAIKENTAGATVIIVAQRINTILDADKILVVDKGRIVGQGTHKELMENCELYADIARTQLA